jgi:hypothetical protein
MRTYINWSLAILLSILLLSVLRGNDLPVGSPKHKEEVVEPDAPEPEEDDGIRLYDEDLPASKEGICYVLDISGSMSGNYTSYVNEYGQVVSGSKLDRAKSELIKSIRALSEDFKFNIIAYDCSMNICFSPGVDLKEANTTNKTIASAWISSLRARGGTGTGPAGALGLSNKEVMTEVLLSDGAPGCGASTMDGHRKMIHDANTQGAVIHTFGIMANGIFRNFMISVSLPTGGLHFDVN